MRILIVEDNPGHLRDAIDTLTHLVGVEVVTATNYCDAYRQIDGGRYDLDGVVTDIFMPFSSEPKRDSSELKYDANEPCGVGVALCAKKNKIPCVICTDEWHHGLRVNWIYTIAQEDLGAKMIDSEDPDGRSEKKNWLTAFEYLKKRIGEST